MLPAPVNLSFPALAHRYMPPAPVRKSLSCVPYRLERGIVTEESSPLKQIVMAVLITARPIAHVTPCPQLIVSSPALDC